MKDRIICCDCMKTIRTAFGCQDGKVRCAGCTVDYCLINNNYPIDVRKLVVIKSSSESV
jgi:hypothetical protein